MHRDGITTLHSARMSGSNQLPSTRDKAVSRLRAAPSLSARAACNLRVKARKCLSRRSAAGHSSNQTDRQRGQAGHARWCEQRLGEEAVCRTSCSSSGLPREKGLQPCRVASSLAVTYVSWRQNAGLAQSTFSSEASCRSAMHASRRSDRVYAVVQLMSAVLSYIQSPVVAFRRCFARCLLAHPTASPASARRKPLMPTLRNKHCKRRLHAFAQVR